VIDLFSSTEGFQSWWASYGEFVCAGCLRKRKTFGALGHAIGPGGEITAIYALCGPCDRALNPSDPDHEGIPTGAPDTESLKARIIEHLRTEPTVLRR
jgi:hypothetical protein